MRAGRLAGSLTLLLTCGACGGTVASETTPGADASADVRPQDSEPVVDVTVDSPTQLDATAESPPAVDSPPDSVPVDGPTELDAPAEATPKPCVPSTCGGQDCGWAADGCGHAIFCGDCLAPEYCGGGGFNICGGCGFPCGLCNDGGACMPITCAAQNIPCGPAPDGCGGTLLCGPCDGGGQCYPRTCAALGYDCGFVGDGCGGLLNCGNCTPPETCGGAGLPNQCGLPDGGGFCCSPATCTMQGIECGAAGDGCGHLIQCGTCASGETCGGGGFGRCG